MNETRVIERLNQKHSSGRKPVVLCGQREREREREREIEGEKGWFQKYLSESSLERGGREGGNNTGYTHSDLLLSYSHIGIPSLPQLSLSLTTQDHWFPSTAM